MVERSPLQLAAWAVVAVLAVAAAAKLLLPAGSGELASPVRVGGPSTRPSQGGGGQAYVHVAGEVRRPGLYRVPASARVAVALERAGGPTRRADLATVNLAARVEDGRQIVVPRAGAAAATAGAPGTDAGTAPAGAGAAGAGGARISLATATVEQLDTLDGIGPTLAKRIVEYRDSHGGFRSVEELRQVEGIGEKRFAALRDAVQP